MHELGLCSSIVEAIECGAAWDGDEIPLACPTCGAVEVELVGGDELMLESIEYQG